MGIFSRLKKKSEQPKQTASRPAPTQPPPPRQAAPRTAVTPAKSKVDDVTQEIKNRRDHIQLLQKNSAYKTKQAEMEMKKALAAKQRGDKSAALQCMKRKKMYEKARDTINRQIEQIEQVIETMEAQIRNAEVVKGIASATTQMQKVGVDVDKADEVLGDMQETMEKVEDVNNAFRQTTFGEQYDEDELLAELDAETDQAKIQSVSTPQDDLQVPSAKPKVPAVPQESEEERELRELERQMAATSS